MQVVVVPPMAGLVAVGGQPLSPQQGEASASSGKKRASSRQKPEQAKLRTTCRANKHGLPALLPLRACRRIDAAKAPAEAGPAVPGAPVYCPVRLRASKCGIVDVEARREASSSAVGIGGPDDAAFCTFGTSSMPKMAGPGGFTLPREPEAAPRDPEAPPPRLTSSEVGGKRCNEGLVTEPHTRKKACSGWTLLGCFFFSARGRRREADAPRASLYLKGLTANKKRGFAIAIRVFAFAVCREG